MVEIYNSDPLTHKGRFFRYHNGTTFEIEGDIAKEPYWQAGNKQFTAEEYDSALAAYEANEKDTTEIEEWLKRIHERAQRATTISPPTQSLAVDVAAR